MSEKPKKSDYFSDLMNKVVVCEALNGKTITGVLTGYNQYELHLIESKDIKSKTPRKTLIFKHRLVSVKEME